MKNIERNLFNLKANKSHTHEDINKRLYILETSTPTGGTGSTGGVADSANKLTTPRNITIGSTTKAFDGSSAISWTLTEIGASPTSHTHNYASATHTHDIYSLTTHTHSNYSPTSHTHTNYSLTTHTHDYAPTIHTHDYAPTSHTHDVYSLTTHTHSYAPLTHTHDYAPTSHTHDIYSLTTHTHNYASATHTHDSVAKLTTARNITIGSTTRSFDGSSAISWSLSEIGASPTSHTHTDYSLSTHTHSNYSLSTHTHDYAPTSHTHTDYSLSTHTHSNYSLSTHTHDYAPTSHTHSYLPLSGGTLTGALNLNSNAVFSNDCYIYHKDTEGTNRSMMALTDGDLVLIGKGMYDISKGATLLYGNELYLRSQQEVFLQTAGSNSTASVYCIRFDTVDSNAYFRPTTDNGTRCGSSANRWSTVYSAGGVSTSSDRRLKENIKYLEYENINVNVETTNEISTKDCLDFITNDYIMATYNYISDEYKETKLSAIAQDVLISEDGTENKIGTLVVNCEEVKRENGNLGMNQTQLLNVLIGAVQELSNQINELKGE